MVLELRVNIGNKLQGPWSSVNESLTEALVRMRTQLHMQAITATRSNKVIVGLRFAPLWLGWTARTRIKA